MSGGEGGTLLLRFHALLAGLTAGDLSSADANVLGWFAEYAGGEKLEAWPALKTLEVATGLSRRQVCRSIGRLRQLGYIAVARPGSREGVTTRHRLTLKGVADIGSRKSAASARSEKAVEGSDSTVTRGSDIAVTTVVTNRVEGGDKTVPEVVTALSPKPTINRAGSAVDEVVVDLPSASPPAASTAAEAAGSPGGDRPTAARAPGQIEHPWFWDLYPKHLNVAAADKLLGELLAGGVSRADIEAGLRAYADDVRRRHLDSKYIALPLNWLRRELWLDRSSGSETVERDGRGQRDLPAKAPKRAQEPRSGGGKGEAAKPAKAAKKAKEETPEERAERLAAAKAKKAQQERERIDRQQREAEELQDRTTKALAWRDELVRELVAGGVPRDSLENWIINAYVNGRQSISDQERDSMKRGLTKAMAYRAGDGDRGQSLFVGWFGEDRSITRMPKMAQRTIDYYHAYQRDYKERKFAERQQGFEAKLADLPPYEANRRRVLWVFEDAGVFDVNAMAEMAAAGLIAAGDEKQDSAAVLTKFLLHALSFSLKHTATMDLFDGEHMNDNTRRLIDAARAEIKRRALDR